MPGTLPSTFEGKMAHKNIYEQESCQATCQANSIFPGHFSLEDRNLAKHLAKHNPKFLVRFGMLIRTLPSMKTWMNAGENLALHKKVPWSLLTKQVSLLSIVDRPEKICLGVSLPHTMERCLHFKHYLPLRFCYMWCILCIFLYVCILCILYVYVSPR